MFDFITKQILGMQWINQLVGSLLQTIGINTSLRFGGSLQFFIYDTVKIFHFEQPLDMTYFYTYFYHKLYSNLFST